ncbi:MAG: TlpA disulfide reductase family protein [Halocynthiibacter sp.]
MNFWATWCAPCREEMPALDALQLKIGGDDFQVMTIATGRNRLSGINRFYEDANVTTLPILLDPKGKLATRMGALGLPVTILLNREGREIARLTGGADWATENAMAVLQALMDAE